MRSTLAVTALIAALGLLTAAAPAAPAATIKVCGQAQGPSASWSDRIPGYGTFRFKGKTWTVFATRVPCSFAMKTAPSLLKKWPRAGIGDSRLAVGLSSLKGWLCTKEKATGYSGTGVSSGSIGCAKGLQFIEIRMLAPYTLAQIKQVAASGKLP